MRRNGDRQPPVRTSRLASAVATMKPCSARSSIRSGTGLAPPTMTWLSRTDCLAACSPGQIAAMASVPTSIELLNGAAVIMATAAVHAPTA